MADIREQKSGSVSHKLPQRVPHLCKKFYKKCEIWIETSALWAPLSDARYHRDRFLSEPVREKTNNASSNQVRHKPGCSVAEDG